MSYLKCQDCGEEKEDVRETTCPYDSEINEIETPITVCGDCYHQRGMDI